jgi:hypothetical protein
VPLRVVNDRTGPGHDMQIDVQMQKDDANNHEC